MTTDDRSLERAARAWLEEGPTRAPDRAVDAAFLQVETTSQAPDITAWRLPKVNRTIRFAIVAAVAVIAIAGGAYVLKLPAGQAGAPTAGPAATGPATVEGVWEVTFAHDEMRATGLTDSSEDNPANYGHFNLDLHGGFFQLTQLDGPKATDSGQYRVSGGMLTFTYVSREPIDMPFTVTATTLTIGRGGPVYLHVKPWTRVGP
jgi:hypothetical protein